MEIESIMEEDTERVKKRPNKSSAFSKQKRKKWLFAYLMLVPAVINFAVFYLGVNVNSVIMAFQKPIQSSGGIAYEFSFENFTRMFRELIISTQDLHTGFLNTLKYFAASLLITLPISYFTSYFLYKKVWGSKFFRVVFFLPSILPALIFVSTFQNMLAIGGPLDSLWRSLFGTRFPPLLSQPETATNTIVFFTIWTGLGVNMLLYQGAMGRIPEEILDAAKLDGVGWVREMFQIVTPMIWPTLSTTIILALSKVFLATGPIMLFGGVGGEPFYGTTTISYFIFQKAYGNTSVEYAAAISVFFTLVSFPIVLFVRWIFGKIDPEVEY